MAKVRMHQHLIDPDQKCHSLYAIAMAREHDIPGILPTAILFRLYHLTSHAHPNSL